MSQDISMIKVSFIVPTKNSGHTIIEALESIKRQNLAHYEVVVVDNGSTDDTLEKCATYKCIVFHNNEGNVSTSRNMGAAGSSFDYLCFVDSDIIIPDNWIQQAITRLHETKSVLCGSKAVKPLPNETWVSKAWIDHLFVSEQNQIKNTKWVPTQLMLVTSIAFKSVEGFDETLVSCEDVEFCHRVSEKYKITSSADLAPYHLGNPKTIKEFYKKQLWHGESSAKVSLGLLRGSTKFEYKELLSLLVAAAPLLVFFTTLFIFDVGILMSFALTFLIIFLTSLAKSILVYKSLGQNKGALELAGLYSLYIFSRFHALIRELKFHYDQRKQDKKA